MSIGIGTAQFGMDYGISNYDGKTPFAETEKILLYAANNKIEVLDTAAEYGDSEDTIGKIVSDNKYNFNIITKVSKEANIDNDVENSLKKLRLESIYGVLIHNTSVLFDSRRKDIYKKLLSKKHSGAIQKIGVSVYTPEETMAILKNFDIDIIQIPSSICDQRFVRSGVIDILKNNNIEIHVRSIFLQGLYFLYPSRMPGGFEDIKKKLIELDNISFDSGVSKTKLIVEYAKSLHVDRIIVGVNNVRQLKEIHECYMSDVIDVDFRRFSLEKDIIDPRVWRQ